MEAVMFYLYSGVVTYFIAAAGWIAATIMLAIKVSRGAGRAEKLLLTGSCLMLAGSLFNVPSSAIRTILTDRGYALQTMATLIPVLGILNLLGVLAGLAGIITIVFAFWHKFRTERGS